MSTTTHDVLLSDERILASCSSDFDMSPLQVRDIYEANRTKLLDLLQQGVDAAKVVASRRGPFHADIETHRFLSKVKEQLPNL